MGYDYGVESSPDNLCQEHPWERGLRASCSEGEAKLMDNRDTTRERPRDLAPKSQHQGSSSSPFGKDAAARQFAAQITNAPGNVHTRHGRPGRPTLQHQGSRRPTSQNSSGISTLWCRRRAVVRPRPISDFPSNVLHPPPIGSMEDPEAESATCADTQASSRRKLWKNAMARGLQGLTANSTLSWATEPPGSNTVGLEWM